MHTTKGIGNQATNAISVVSDSIAHSSFDFGSVFIEKAQRII